MGIEDQRNSRTYEIHHLQALGHHLFLSLSHLSLYGIISRLGLIFLQIGLSYEKCRVLGVSLNLPGFPREHQANIQNQEKPICCFLISMVLR